MEVAPLGRLISDPEPISGCQDPATGTLQGNKQALGMPQGKTGEGLTTAKESLQLDQHLDGVYHGPSVARTGTSDAETRCVAVLRVLSHRHTRNVRGSCKYSREVIGEGVVADGESYP